MKKTFNIGFQEDDLLVKNIIEKYVAMTDESMSKYTRFRKTNKTKYYKDLKKNGNISYSTEYDLYKTQFLEPKNRDLTQTKLSLDDAFGKYFDGMKNGHLMKYVVNDNDTITVNNVPVSILNILYDLSKFDGKNNGASLYIGNYFPFYKNEAKETVQISFNENNLIFSKIYKKISEYNPSMMEGLANNVIRHTEYINGVETKINKDPATTIKSDPLIISEVTKNGNRVVSTKETLKKFPINDISVDIIVGKNIFDGFIASIISLFLFASIKEREFANKDISEQFNILNIPRQNTITQENAQKIKNIFKNIKGYINKFCNIDSSEINFDGETVNIEGDLSANRINLLITNINKETDDGKILFKFIELFTEYFLLYEIELDDVRNSYDNNEKTEKINEFYNLVMYLCDTLNTEQKKVVMTIVLLKINLYEVFELDTDKKLFNILINNEINDTNIIDTIITYSIITPKKNFVLLEKEQKTMKHLSIFDKKYLLGSIHVNKIKTNRIISDERELIQTSPLLLFVYHKIFHRNSLCLFKTLNYYFANKQINFNDPALILEIDKLGVKNYNNKDFITNSVQLSEYLNKNKDSYIKQILFLSQCLSISDTDTLYIKLCINLFSEHQDISNYKILLEKYDLVKNYYDYNIFKQYLLESVFDKYIQCTINNNNSLTFANEIFYYEPLDMLYDINDDSYSLENFGEKFGNTIDKAANLFYNNLYYLLFASKKSKNYNNVLWNKVIKDNCDMIKIILERNSTEAINTINKICHIRKYDINNNLEYYTSCHKNITKMIVNNYLYDIGVLNSVNYSRSYNEIKSHENIFTLLGYVEILFCGYTTEFINNEKINDMSLYNDISKYINVGEVLHEVLNNNIYSSSNQSFNELINNFKTLNNIKVNMSGEHYNNPFSKFFKRFFIDNTEIFEIVKLAFGNYSVITNEIQNSLEKKDNNKYTNELTINANNHIIKQYNIINDILYFGFRPLFMLNMCYLMYNITFL